MPTPERFHLLRQVLERRQPDLTVVMDGVNKSHNFSAILRTCDAVGVLEAHAVPAERAGMPVHTSTSAGSAKWVRVRRHTTIEDALGALRDCGLRIAAAHATPEARDFREVDYTEPIALLVGAELDGISERGLELADLTVRIPMEGMVASLNVSVATATILYEAQRQRAAAGMYDTPRLSEEEMRPILFRWAYPRVARLFDARGQPYPELDDDGRIRAEA